MTARRRRNQGRLAKLHEMRAQRAAMLGAAGTAKLALAKDDVRSKTVIDAEHVGKSYGERPIIRDFSLRIQRGDRIGLVGPNGAGKTTLLKLLTGELAPDSGTVTRRQDAERDRHRPAAQADGAGQAGDATCSPTAATGSRCAAHKKHIKGYLKEFLFDPALADAPIGSLSGGERSRLLLAREFAREANLLVLDEPTNDLDLETLDLLQEVIADYDGTVLIVSHDRDFLDRTVTITLGLDGSGKVDIVAGGYEDWVRKRYQAVVVPRRRPGPRALRQQRLPALLDPGLRRGTSCPTRTSAITTACRARSSGWRPRSRPTRRRFTIPTSTRAIPDRFAELTERIARNRAEIEAAELRWLEVAEMAEALARLRLQAILLEQVVERRPADPEQLGGARNIVVGAAHRLADGLAVGDFARGAQVDRARLSPSCCEPAGRGRRRSTLLPSAMITARLMRFSSSRTLPGQG